MADHLSEQQLDRYRRRALNPAELLSADRHLATCDACHQRAIEGSPMRDLREVFVGGAADRGRSDADHLSYEQLVSLVDDTIDDVDREIAEVHLAVCPQCAEDLSSLQALKASQPRSAAPAVWQRWPAWAAAAGIVLAAGWVLLGPGRAWWQRAVVHDEPATVERVPSADIVAVIKDGRGEITLDATGHVRGIDAVAATPIGDAVTTALTSRQLRIAPALEGLRTTTSPLMGDTGPGAPFALTAPVGVVVLSDRPTFRWQRLPGASTYVARVYERGFNEVAHSANQTSTEWTIPFPLTRGAIYTWQVTAQRNGEDVKSPVPPAAEARFKILAANDAALLERTLATNVDGHLVRGIVYAEAGLLQEAERELRLVRAANPDSPIVRDLLREVTNGASRR